MNPVSLLSIGTLAGAGTSAVRTASRVAGGFGDRLQEAIRGANGRPVPESPSPSPSIAEHAKAALRELRARIRGLLAREGISLDRPLIVAQDQFDRIRVVGDHPRREQIEAALEAEPEIGDALRDLASRLHRLQVGGAGTPADLPVAYVREGKPTIELSVPPLGA